MRKALVIPVLAVAVTASAASAQLNGIYTIDNAQPTAGTNYTSLIDAAAALVAQGVSGPVAFLVSPGIGAYAGFAITAAITGSSAANIVVFQAAGPVVISGAAAGFTQTIRLGTTGVTILTGPANIIIDGFEVTGAATGAGIIATGCSNITVRNCRVHTCGSGIDFNACSNTLIEDNEVYSVGVTVGTPGSASYAGGISSYYNNHNCTIQRNRVHDCTNQGIFVGSSGGTTAPATNIVINNFVWNCPGTGTYSGGIAIRRSGGSVFSNNSVWMPAGSAIGGIHQMGATTDPQPAEISNNIVKHDGTGPCFRFESATTGLATTFDYNLYDPAPTAFVGGVGATNYATLAAWQALAAPNLAGKEVNTLAGAAGFLTTTDLHITPASLGFNNGSTVAAVVLDIDGQSRPIAGIPDRGADETPATGLFAAFSAAPATGSAPLSVSFTDQTFTSDPGGVLTWAWDFQNDGTDDAFIQNPSFIYYCPGSYSVKLTVTDASNPASALVRTNLITVTPQPFVMTTSGSGIGDLTINPVPSVCYPGTTEGWTLISFSTASGAAGTGPFGGLYPDIFTISYLLTPASPGNPLHFLVNGLTYPDGGAFSLPPGTFSSIAGASLDAVEVLVNSGLGIVRITNVARVTF